MELLKKEFGEYCTNCYILGTEIGEFIIDPGMGATSWVCENVKNPLAILNTHGHFDHMWSNAELIKKLQTPLFCPKQDSFMLESDCFNLGLSPCLPSKLGFGVESNEKILFKKSGEFMRDFVESSDLDSSINGVLVEFMHFPGHTPGCSMIKIGDFIFSGDFIFYRSIGRSDFPYSNNADMRESLLKFGEIGYDLPLYPGHGQSTMIKAEQENLHSWIRFLT